WGDDVDLSRARSIAHHGQTLQRISDTVLPPGGEPRLLSRPIEWKFEQMSGRVDYLDKLPDAKVGVELELLPGSRFRDYVGTKTGTLRGLVGPLLDPDAHLPETLEERIALRQELERLAARHGISDIQGLPLRLVPDKQY